MERARSDMLRAAGIDQRAAKEDGTGVYAVAEVGIKYVRPAKLGDDLLVLSTVQQVRAASVIIHQRVMRGPNYWPMPASPQPSSITATGRSASRAPGSRIQTISED